MLQTTVLVLNIGAQASVYGDTTISMMSFPPSSQPIGNAIILQDDNPVSGFDTIYPSITTTPLAQNARFAAQKIQKNGNHLLVSTDWHRGTSIINGVQNFVNSDTQTSDTLQLASAYRVPLTDSWSGFVEAGMNVEDRNAATISDGYNLITTAGASYSMNPSLKFSIGLLASKSSFSAAQAMPFIGLDWSITDRLRLRTFNGAFLSYDLGKSTAIDLSLQYLDRSFAIENRQGTVFMKMDQPLVMEQSSIIGTLGVRHYWKDVFSIRAFAEFAGNHETHATAPIDGVSVIQAPSADDKRIAFGVEGGIRF